MICDYQRDYRIFSRRLRGFAQKAPEINSAVIWDYQRDSIKFFSPADYKGFAQKTPGINSAICAILAQIARICAEKLHESILRRSAISAGFNKIFRRHCKLQGPAGIKLL
jgi:hypothetical protein